MTDTDIDDYIRTLRFFYTSWDKVGVCETFGEQDLEGRLTKTGRIAAHECLRFPETLAAYQRGHAAAVQAAIDRRLTLESTQPPPQYNKRLADLREFYMLSKRTRNNACYWLGANGRKSYWFGKGMEDECTQTEELRTAFYRGRS